MWKKRGREEQATYKNTAHACWITKTTFRICNTCCFSTATEVTRTTSMLWYTRVAFLVTHALYTTQTGCFELSFIMIDFRNNVLFLSTSVSAVLWFIFIILLQDRRLSWKWFLLQIQDAHKLFYYSCICLKHFSRCADVNTKHNCLYVVRCYCVDWLCWEYS